MSLASLSDLDGDGVGDMAVGARFDDDGGGNRGAVWVLFLRSDGTVKGHQKISDTEGAFTGQLDGGDEFGVSLASLSDLDGDGVVDLAVGARGDDDGGSGTGTVWVLALGPVAVLAESPAIHRLTPLPGSAARPSSSSPVSLDVSIGILQANQRTFVVLEGEPLEVDR